MAKKLVHLYIDEDYLETSDTLRRNTIKSDEMTFFKLSTQSKNAWNCFVFQMGLIAVRKKLEKLGDEMGEDD